MKNFWRQFGWLVKHKEITNAETVQEVCYSLRSQEKGIMVCRVRKTPEQ